MKIEYNYGAMYVTLDEEKIDMEPVELGKKTIKVGDCFKSLGEGKKNTFYLDGGMSLKYVGRVEEKLLFNTNKEIYDYNKGKIYYCFIRKTKDKLILKISETNVKELPLDNLEIESTMEVKAKGDKIEDYRA